MPLTGSHLINGKFEQSTPTFAATNPQSADPLPPQFCQAGQKEVNAALSAAAASVETLRSADPLWPAALLDAIAEQILNLGDTLLDRAHLETALPKTRLTAERARTVGQLKLFSDIVRRGEWLDATIDTAEPNRQPMPRPDIRRMLIPRGPVIVFGASNFPFAFGTLGGDTASAIAAGNPVIVKGHPSHPGTSELFAQAVLNALNALKLPPGLFALLQGTSHELSNELIDHPATTAVGFTGSQKAGRALFDRAARRGRPIPVYAEMGSLNPLIILPGALRSRGNSIARDLANSLLLGGGQFCTKPGLIITIGNADAFLTDLLSNLAAAPPMTMLNPSLRDSFLARTTQWSQLPGVVTRLKPNSPGPAGISPALFETSPEIFAKHPALAEEAFGPAGLIVRCERAEQVSPILHQIGGSLTGAIHADPDDNPRALLDSLSEIVGRIILNGYPTGVEVCRAIVHGGPYPATTDSATTSVGAAAIVRFSRMIAYQSTPDTLLPPALQNANPLNIPRTVNGKRTAEPLPHSA
jgi:NADP-dependent aldehyde dehydrogenase